VTLLVEEMDTLRNLQRFIGAANAIKGFHDEGDIMRFAAETSATFAENNLVAAIFGTDVDLAEIQAANLRNYYANKLLLIVSEAVEAHDELRTGHGMTETYYAPLIDEWGKVTGAGWEDGPQKPEGVPSELADVVIRVFDLADEAGIDLAGMIDEKLRYNATRPYRHGKRF